MALEEGLFDLWWLASMIYLLYSPGAHYVFPDYFLVVWSISLSHGQAGAVAGMDSRFRPAHSGAFFRSAH